MDGITLNYNSGFVIVCITDVLCESLYLPDFTIPLYHICAYKHFISVSLKYLNVCFLVTCFQPRDGFHNIPLCTLGYKIYIL